MGAHVPVADESGSYRKWPCNCAPLLQMAVDVAPAFPMLWPTARFHIRGACLSHAGLDRTAHSLTGFDQRPQTHAAIEIARVRRSSGVLHPDPDATADFRH